VRYYNIVLSNAAGQIYQPSIAGFVLSKTGPTFTSWVQGPYGMQTDPGALNVEFDFPVYNFHQSQGRQWTRVHGIGLQMIGQAANLNGANIQLSAGMKPGLPLATAAAAQAGLLLQGTVFQAFGNWEGTNQTLELVCNPGADNVSNISWNWPPGMPMSSAIQQTLQRAFPTYSISINIGPNLFLANTEPGTYRNLQAFASYLNEISLKAGGSVYGEKYPGILMAVTGNTIVVYDTQGPTPPKMIQLAFQDLIGQPTWITATQISFKTVLRGDIGLGMVVKFPQGINAPYALTSINAAYPGQPVSNRSAFQGPFLVSEVHHFANFRQADAQSWNTSFVASALPPTLGAA
jgi:hypothetical protein